MSKKPPAKYRLTQETLWVARKRGTETGYGAKPADAFNNATDRSEKRQEQIRRHSRLGIDYHDLFTKYGKAEQALHKLRFELDAIKADRMTHHDDVADGYVMMAMAYCRTTDPLKALDMLRDRLGVTVEEEKAAKRVKEYMTRWIKKLGDPELANG